MYPSSYWHPSLCWICLISKHLQFPICFPILILYCAILRAVITLSQRRREVKHKADGWLVVGRTHVFLWDTRHHCSWAPKLWCCYIPSIWNKFLSFSSSVWQQDMIYHQKLSSANQLPPPLFRLSNKYTCVRFLTSLCLLFHAIASQSPSWFTSLEASSKLLC